jgi:hypothetical protein
MFAKAGTGLGQKKYAEKRDIEDGDGIMTTGFL